MFKKKKFISFVFGLSFLLVSCVTNKEEENYDAISLLYTMFPDFHLGVAVNDSSYFETTSEYNSLLKQFNGYFLRTR